MRIWTIRHIHVWGSLPNMGIEREWSTHWANVKLSFFNNDLSECKVCERSRQFVKTKVSWKIIVKVHHTFFIILFFKLEEKWNRWTNTVPFEVKLFINIIIWFVLYFVLGIEYRKVESCCWLSVSKARL